MSRSASCWGRANSVMPSPCWAICSTWAIARKPISPIWRNHRVTTTGHQLRHQQALTRDAVVRLAEAAQDRYGFKDFKLKGGVLPGEQEIETARALKNVSRRRVSPLTLTAPGCWRKPSAVQRSGRRADLRRRPVWRGAGLLWP